MPKKKSKTRSFLDDLGTPLNLDNIYKSKIIEQKIFVIANCRGKKPVITDLKKVCRTLAGIRSEMNECKAKRVLEKVENSISEILIADNPNIEIYK